jgi:hypothetical protein
MSAFQPLGTLGGGAIIPLWPVSSEKDGSLRKQEMQKCGIFWRGFVPSIQSSASPSIIHTFDWPKSFQLPKQRQGGARRRRHCPMQRLDWGPLTFLRRRNATVPARPALNSANVIGSGTFTPSKLVSTAASKGSPSVVNEKAMSVK